jgi:hypothetical protein
VIAEPEYDTPPPPMQARDWLILAAIAAIAALVARACA